MIPFFGLQTTLTPGATQAVTVEIWDDAAAGTLIANESHPAVSVDEAGRISFVFGSVLGGLNPDHFPSGSSRFLDVIDPGTGTSVLVGGRIALNATAFALSAATAGTATNALQLGGVQANQYVTTTSGDANYIRNTTAPQTGDFNISGSGVIGGSLGIGTLSPTSTLDVRGRLTLDPGTGSPVVLYTAASGGEQNRYLELINAPTFPSASGLKAGGVLVADTYSFAQPAKNDLIVKGKVVIGFPTIQSATLYADASTNDAVAGGSSSGRGVYGTSSNANGVEGLSVNSHGVYGRTSGGSNVAGVRGVSVGANGIGVRGDANNGPLAIGVYGTSNIGYAGLFSGKCQSKAIWRFRFSARRETRHCAATFKVGVRSPRAHQASATRPTCDRSSAGSTSSVVCGRLRSPGRRAGCATSA